MKIDILGTPFNGLAHNGNIENPAEGIRHAGLIHHLERDGHHVNDLGDISGFHCNGIPDPKTGINDFNTWVDLSEAISQRIEPSLRQKNYPIVLGGDCRLLIGVFDSLSNLDLQTGLVFIDGHADFHTIETSPTGDPADMELAVLTGQGPEPITKISSRYPLIDEDDIIVYGIRAWDTIERSSIHVCESNKMKALGIEKAAAVGIEHMAKKKIPVWVHFDVDVFDPFIMPVMYPEPDGLTENDITRLLRAVHDSLPVAGLSIACYHPDLDRDGRAAKMLVRIVSNLLSGNGE